jgi:hypothetical protein
MRKKVISILACLVISTTLSFGQFTFGVSPGLGLNSAYFGYKVNKFVPYFSLQVLNANFGYENTGQEFDYNIGQVVPYTESSNFSGSLFIPNLGLKYFLKEHNKIQSYASLNLSKPFLTGKIEYDGLEDQNFKETVKNISLWGAEVSFGVEYFLDENFSLGGEFGLRYFHLKYEETNDRQIFNPNSGDNQTVQVEDSFKFNMSPTYSKISLNYYF